MIEALQLLPGFARLDADALQVIISRSNLRRFAPGQTVLAAGKVADVLLGCIDGELVGAGGTAAPPVFDAPGLLFGLEARQEYRAGSSGLAALAVPKPYVFTIAREFPEFIVALIGLGEATP
ncbi:Crp/Fnr family transcriptional regulator [Rhizorhabdus argentea]|uniref:Crp/Fnr family transcriptional regulator n=1 Tax=Rhizorhabdus argentea TaxID=1387174 RepID=UPI0030EB199A